MNNDFRRVRLVELRVAERIEIPHVQQHGILLRFSESQERDTSLLLRDSNKYNFFVGLIGLTRRVRYVNIGDSESIRDETATIL